MGVLAGAFLFLLVIPSSMIGWHKNLHYLDVWQKQVVTNERVGLKASFNIHSFRNQSLANAMYLWSKSTRQSFMPLSALRAGRRSAGTDRPPERQSCHRSDPDRFTRGGPASSARASNSLDAFTRLAGQLRTLLVSPLSWGHYFMVELPALICVPIWLWKLGMPIAAGLPQWFRSCSRGPIT